jgi:hypothetical protein
MTIMQRQRLRIGDLETEIKRLQLENTILRKQLAAAVVEVWRLVGASTRMEAS